MIRCFLSSPSNECDSESVGFQRIEPHDLFGFLLAFFRSLHVTDDCADRIGTTRGRGRGGISLLLIRFHRTFVHDRAKIRLCVHGLLAVPCHGWYPHGNGRKWRESSEMERGNKGALTAPPPSRRKGEFCSTGVLCMCALSNASFLYKMETNAFGEGAVQSILNGRGLTTMMAC